MALRLLPFQGGMLPVSPIPGVPLRSAPGYVPAALSGRMA